MNDNKSKAAGQAGVPPLISVVGKSNSGKTTFLEKLIAEFKQRGCKVGVIKHDAHSFEIDHKGKDSYRLKHAGADTMIISSSTQLAMVKNTTEDTALVNLRAAYMMDMDIILAEGYKRERAHKIEISRRENSTDILCEEDDCLALVTNWNPPLDVPKFALDDVQGIADMIQQRFLNNSSGCGQRHCEGTSNDRV